MSKVAKKGAKLFALKKGIQWSGGLLKMGAIAGAGYLAYKVYQKNCHRLPSFQKH